MLESGRCVEWYVSNVSIIFDCSMLYYILFWTLLGFIIHFYIIFRTNLLTGGPAQNCCFFLPILEFRRKRISNGVQTEWNLRGRDFWNKHDPEDLDPTSKHQPGGHEVGGRAVTPSMRLYLLLVEARLRGITALKVMSQVRQSLQHPM